MTEFLTMLCYFICYLTSFLRQGDIPGYTGCKYWTDTLPARRHNDEPWQTTSARVHRSVTIVINLVL